jgi:flagellar basal body rod protein FlgC
MNSAMSIAASGAAAAANRFSTAASNLVRATTSDAPSDTAQPIVDMIESRAAFTANLAVLKAADKMSKSLLDIVA